MKILIAEDEPVSRHLLQSFLLKWDYEVIAVTDGPAALRTIQRDDPPRLAILDWMMPGLDGVEVCREIRKLEEKPYVYVILLTTKNQKQEIASGLEAGADDYVTKPFNAHELRARLRAGCRILELQEQLIAQREALRVEATHDALTGLWNRAAIFEILHREMARAERDETSVAVILADLDHFKNINDAHGHLAGDAVLREVTRRMHSSIRPYDAMGRYGGEEFLIVAPGCGAADSLKQAERLRARVGNHPIETFDGAFPVTLSMGVAAGKDRKAVEALLRAADQALYRAKNGGRNRVELAALPATAAGESPEVSTLPTPLPPSS